MKLPEELQFIENAKKPQKTTQAHMDGRLCVLTGATSGVGYQATRRLMQGGADMVIVSRNIEKARQVKSDLEKAFGTKCEIVTADFSRLREVRKAAETILSNYDHIDVLINNAGVHMTHRILTEDGYETAFAVNHLASFLFTRLLMEKMKSSAPARILQVSSQGHRFGGLDLGDINWEKRRYNGYRGYGASKTAQLLTVWEMADRLAGSEVTINAIHPGEVKTNIGMNNELLFQWYQRVFIWWMLKDPVISGEAIYYLAAAPEMAGVSGKYYNLTIEEKPTRQALDRQMGNEIWRLSEEMTGL
jgi:NAD(P)-dependent dehydrogenase (short-subunit alcohol dehydrogenase family)